MIQIAIVLFAINRSDPFHRKKIDDGLFIDPDRRKPDRSRFEFFHSFAAQPQNPGVKIEGAVDVAYIENNMVELINFDRHGSPPAPLAH